MNSPVHPDFSRAAPRARYEFKAGDRVRLNRSITSKQYEGAVVQDLCSTSAADKVLVKPDNVSQSFFVSASRLEKIAPLRTSMSPQESQEKFRRCPTMRKWETSYTKGVIKELNKLRLFVEMFSGTSLAISKARNLLKGYWQDLHIPYQERDAARAELKKARLENVNLREIIANARRALEHKA